MPSLIEQLRDFWNTETDAVEENEEQINGLRERIQREHQERMRQIHQRAQERHMWTTTDTIGDTIAQEANTPNPQTVQGATTEPQEMVDGDVPEQAYTDFLQTQERTRRKKKRSKPKTNYGKQKRKLDI